MAGAFHFSCLLLTLLSCSALADQHVCDGATCDVDPGDGRYLIQKKSAPIISAKSLNTEEAPEGAPIIHEVSSCSQCGKSFCQESDWKQNQPDVESEYIVGDLLSEFGCSNLPEEPFVLRNSDSGAIYIAQPAILHYVSSCSQCGQNFCSQSMWENSGPNVEATYHVGVTLEEWGCSDLLAQLGPGKGLGVVYNTDTQRIYAVQTVASAQPRYPPTTTTTTTLPYYFAPKGAAECSPGETVSQADCESAVAAVLATMGVKPGGSLQVGAEAYSCNQAWGKVPLGCSVQDDDWTAHYRVEGVAATGCISAGYQLVCDSQELE